MELLIRRAGRPDRDRLVPLVAACFEPAWSAGAIEGALRAPEVRAFVAQPPGDLAPAIVSLAGFVLARRILDIVEIDLVGVAPEARRRRLAARLLTALLEAERTEGAALAQLELRSANHAAAALYAELGFVVVGRRPRYYPDGDDALLLSLALR